MRGRDTSALTLTMVPKLKPLAGASVELFGQVKKTDPRGLVSFVFDNQGVNFKAKVTPPQDADYVARYYRFFNLSNTAASDYQCVLDPAAHISGVVTVGDSVAVADAHVYAEVGNGSDVIPVETTSAEGGKYTLHGIPLSPDQVTIHATRSSNTVTYVGDSKTITVPTDQPVNLSLSIYNDMDITQLLGFPIEISSLQESAGVVTIDGAFVKLPENSCFKAKESELTLQFHDVSLQKGASLDAQGVPYAVPQNPPVQTMASKVDLRLFDAFDVTLLPADQGKMVSVAPGSDGGGEIRGRLRIEPSSFAFSSNLMAPGILELAPRNDATKTTVIAFASDPAKVNASSYAIRGSESNGAISYKLHGFTAMAKAGGAYVRKDTLAIDTTLHADVGKSSPKPIEIPAGWVRARPVGVLDIDNPGAVSLNLEQWKLNATGWRLSASTNGILFQTADINTGAITVPAKNLRITPTDLQIGQVDLEKISLGGVAPLEVLTQNAGFGYDPKVGEDRKGHWKLSLLPDGGTPAAKLGGLPGMKKGAAFTLQSIDLLSNGEQLLGFGANSPAVTFYDVFTLVPGNLVAYDDYFQISGTVDLGIPRLASSYQATLTFRQKAGKTALDLSPIPFAFDAPGKVKFIAHQSEGAQTLGTDGFLAEGKIESSEGVVLKTKLHRTTKKTWIEVDPLGQSLPIGKTKTSLSSVEGEMHVATSSNDWSKFVFSGDMQGAKGMQGDTRKTFTVHGDITADNQGVDVKNIPTPFGDISMTYDYPHGRMTGSLDIDQTFSGTHFVGTANMCVDGDGWYFLTGGAVTMSGFGNLKAGMLIGDYDTMPEVVTETLLQFAYDKHIPASFQHGVSGFFFTGRKNIPQFSIPDTGFNLGAVSAHLGGETGLDARVWMSFDGPGTELGIGAMGFIHAYFILSSI
ncbi:MAG TPA: carboxypeptidase-like regulatory domain-containing protein, partial [Candidatus Krumholzibacteria bacterium]|nr:carboxypeptidase-like regulatory domain-containing protein [Candidatus Krumholzibacteria bacterium]